ncbi:MAG: type 1 glutamine amidotransferase [Gammaproteobacteria bacterium]|nr:type 1 glutamine amidotransferase [Gammaproteobacteria bacterium]
MKPVLVFRHIGCEGPGYLGEFLAARAIPCRVIHVDEGEPVPERIDDAGALVFMGGPMSVYDPLPWVARELALIRRACADGLPVLGHCLGGQLIAKALGAEVDANPVKEIGWHEIVSTDAARNLHGRMPARFEGFHWHGETFGLPPGATLLMSSAHCRHQAFLKDRALALQFHVEVTGAMVREWCAEYRDELAQNAGRTAVQSEEEMTARLEQRITALHRVADTLYDYWLNPA